MRGKVFLLPALLSVLILLLACAPPSDEAWIRIVAFQNPDDDTGVSVLQSNLRDDRSDLVDVVLDNFSTVVGSGGTAGGGVQVFRATVRYALGDYQFPTFDYPVTLFLSSPGEAGEGGNGDTLENLPIVPAALKGWMLNPGNFPREMTTAPFVVEAEVTVRARTEEGTELETSSSLGIGFNEAPQVEEAAEEEAAAYLGPDPG